MDACRTPPPDPPRLLLVGLDVGSTTVKAVVVDPATDAVLWKDYQRHNTRQPEKCLEFLERIECAFPGMAPGWFRVFVTGSGGGGIGRHIGAQFVQEVNAVTLAVEKLYPEVRSVVELGGQDAKIIVFKEDEATGRKKKQPSMNDKCAGGTGAVIDKISAKLRIPAGDLGAMGYVGLKLHPVAGKCGVFAETDVNGLQKQGVPPDELMASLFESIVQQNLSVLTRGHTLRPTVLLLGGPNCYIRGMRDCWRHAIPRIWEERGVALPPGKSVEELIVVPEDAQYFAAIGAVEFGKTELSDAPELGRYAGRDGLRWYVETGRVEEKQNAGSRGLWRTREELDEFRERYRKISWEPARFLPGSVVEGFVGIDGGSTSTKAVLLDCEKRVIAKAYQLSKGNPIEDTVEMLASLERQILDQGCTLEVLGVGTTGYAKDILREVLGADVALVETVAHAESGLHYFPDADVIVDVGGQDIKVIILKSGRVKDFKLNTQCSAGNGYFLQSTAAMFDIPVHEYAEVAFTAESMPQFGYGCAVFMQSDIVDFQRQGWQPNEVLAGLADVLPKNIWLYVSQIPNLPKLGSTFILQGGTQHNLAAVKSQADFILSRYRGTAVTPRVIVHPHCGECGAIGCAMEARRLWSEQGLKSSFIGFDAVRRIRYRTTRNEDTRCYFCKNKCLRTFIDVRTKEEGSGARSGVPTAETKVRSKVPLEEGEQRLIIATCEKGTVEDVSEMRLIKQGLDDAKKRHPNLAATSAKEVFRKPDVLSVADAPPVPPRFALPARRGRVAARAAAMARRRDVRIGIPRVLNLYALAPFFLGYFQSLGVPYPNIIWSDYTSEELYKEGAKRGSIDPCFPSKIGIPHVHNLLYRKHGEKQRLDYILFPMIDSFPSFLQGVQASRSCPTVCATPEATHAAFIKEGDLFAAKGIVFKKTFLNLDREALCARQMHEDWGTELGISEEESRRAAREGLRALSAFQAEMQEQAREILAELEREQRLGVVLLARPYHNDPGVGHEIMDEFQKLGYPVLTQDTLPIDPASLERLFGREVAAGDMSGPLHIDDVWKNSYSENTSRKVWAAKYTARHPNLVALELSSFKCGHDAPIYTVVEEIIENSGTPYFCFKDIDENKPKGSIKIRVETIGYFLGRYRERLLAEREKRAEIEERLRAYEAELRAGPVADPAGQGLAELPAAG